MGKRAGDPAFHSAQSRAQLIAVLLWLPVHVWLLPTVLHRGFGIVDTAQLNVAVYSVSALFMVATQWRFLRRDFDALCEQPGKVLLQICVCYALMMLFNLLTALLLTALLGDGAANPNNDAVADLARVQYGKTTALAVFLAPIVEEPIFRAGIFGGLRSRSRPAAFALSVAAFSAFHVWGYAASDPTAWIYVIQYIPVSYLLCRCYERSDSIWGSIFFHMLVNAISLRALALLEELL